MDATETTFRKGKCHHCSGPVEFPQEMIGSEIECPHCQLTTELLPVYTPREKESLKRFTGPGLGLLACAAFLFVAFKFPETMEVLGVWLAGVVGLVLLSVTIWGIVQCLIYFCSPERMMLSIGLLLLFVGFLWFVAAKTSIHETQAILIFGFGILLIGIQFVIWELRKRK